MSETAAIHVDRDPPPDPPCPPVSYVVGLYPAVSHAWIGREIDALRDLGARVETISIRRASGDHLLSPESQAAAAATYAILPPRWRDLAGAHLVALGRRPLRYLGTLVLALRLSPPGIRGRVWQLFYFVEAIAAWRRCALSGTRHLHAHMANVASDVALLATHFGDGDQGERWTWSFTMHGPWELWNVEQHRLPQKIRAATFVACVSDFTRSQLMANVEEGQWPKLSIVRCGLDPDDFTRRTPYADGGRILTVGRLVVEKGFPILFEAVRRLIGDGLDVTLVVAGAGPEAEALAAEAQRLGIADRVNFTGAVGQDVLRGEYERATVFCLPSFAEALPVVLMEAMALEVPVVATRIAGIPELVEDGVTGCLVSPGRAGELGDVLAALLRDRPARDALRHAGRERVVSDFDSASSARRLVELVTRAAA